MRRLAFALICRCGNRIEPSSRERFTRSGFRAVVVCVDSRFLDDSFAGRDYDEQFLADLPPGVDLCGENGEFHTFVYDGPGFAAPVPFRVASTGSVRRSP